MADVVAPGHRATETKRSNDIRPVRTAIATQPPSTTAHGTGGLRGARQRLEDIVGRLGRAVPQRRMPTYKDLPGFVEEELPALEHIFKTIDTKRDGQLDQAELGAAVQRLGCRVRKEDIAEMIWEVDDDNDGMVNWDEFHSMYMRCHTDRTGFEPRKLFNIVEFMMHDSDCDGHISFDEAIRILYRRFGKQLLDTIEADIVKTDTAMEINFDEFVAFLKRRDQIRQTQKLERYGHTAVRPRRTGQWLPSI